MNLDKFKKVPEEKTITIECEDVDRETGKETAYKVVMFPTFGRKFNMEKANVLTLIASEEIPKEALTPCLVRSIVVSVERDGKKLTSDQIDDLIIANPVLCEYLDQQASKRANFIKPRSGGSSNTQSGDSGKKGQKKAAKG